MGGHEGGEGGGKHEEEGGLGAIGTLMHWMGIGSHVAEGAKPWLEVGHLVHEGKGIFDALGHVGAAEAASVASKGTGGLLPYLGAVTGTIQAGVEGYEAYENFAKEGYHSDKAWTNVGGATLGAAGAAVTFIPGYGPLIGAGLAAGEMAADAGGWAMGKAFGKDAGFSSNQMVGNFIRGTFGDKSWGESVSNMVGG
ncbi:MAG TPA: hypothetical protein VKE22_13305, partial [Haliangiales bacterium]|nr:hypothetical protein [Haliangiales bacterium]